MKGLIHVLDGSPGMVVKVMHVLLMFIHERRHIVQLHLQVHHLEECRQTIYYVCVKATERRSEFQPVKSFLFGKSPQSKSKLQMYSWKHIPAG